MEIAFNFFEYFVFFYASSIVFFYLILGFLAVKKIITYKTYNSEKDEDYILDSPLAPGISVVAPAYNEEVTIISNVHSLLSLIYPEFEVIIINDGSKDKTLKLLIDEFELEETPYAYVEKIKTKPFKRIFKSTNPKYSSLVIVDKENGGTKADASNAGINVAQYPYYLCTDVDCILNRETLSKMIKPILNSNTKVIAVGAALRMSNSCDVEAGVIKQVKPPRPLIPRFQEVEYIRAYLFSKMGWSAVNCIPNISGGLGLFDTEISIKSGGYDSESHAEDMDLLTKMTIHQINNNLPYKVDYIPISCCWTEGPPNLKVLMSQRVRWATGLAQIFKVHKRVILRKRYKRIGLVTFPFAWTYEFLAPIIEFLGILYFIYLIVKGDVNWEMAKYIFLYSYGFAVMVSTMAIFLDNYVEKHYRTKYEVFKLWFIVLLEPFIYHPFLIFFSIKGYFNFFTSRKMEWGAMTRKGVDNKAPIVQQVKTND